MTPGIGTFVATVAVGAILSVPAFASKTPAPAVINPNLKTIPYSLEPADQGVICDNGQLAWPADMEFPAGLKSIYVPSGSEPQAPKGVPARKQFYTLGFDVLQNGRLTNVRTMSAPFPLYDSQFYPTWAAAWSLGPQGETLKGCQMKWTIRTGYTGPKAAVLTREALHLRNMPSGLPRATFNAEECRRAAKRIRTRTYPDRRGFVSKPGHPQWVIERFDIDTGGRTRVTAMVGGNALPENQALVSKALAQHNYYEGEAASECLVSYMIQPDILPSEDKALWPELMSLNRKITPDKPVSETCPETMRREILNFKYRPEYYPRSAQRFKIEGVASLTYDVAPWGEVKISESWSHPLPAFAAAAESMLRQSEAKTSDRGLSGCKVKVKFVISPDSVENRDGGSVELIGADDEAL